MPHIEPFRGILYNPGKAKADKVVAPPYDVISPEMQDELYRASDYNIVRLILGKEEPGDSEENNKYKRARQFFNEWLGKEILIQDKEPAIYVYAQEYSHKKKNKGGLGFIACMKIEDPGTSRVLPHEKTFAKPKEDRLNLIREVNANLSSVFTLFEDEAGEVAAVLRQVLKEKPAIDVKQEGVRHKLWKLKDRAAVSKIQKLMSGKDIFIADGHHRYEVATMYRNEMRSKEGPGKGYDYVMMYFSPMDEKILTILSTHRLIKEIGMDIEELLKRMEAYFDIKVLKNAKQLFEEMNAVKSDEYAFGIYYKNKSFYLLKLKKDINPDSAIKENRSSEYKRLDVAILHGLIFDNILGLKEKIADAQNVIYTRDEDYAIDEVNKGTCEAAFFLNPTRVSQVRDVARIGDKMPHKSTYFYPKLLSGLVINKL